MQSRRRFKQVSSLTIRLAERADALRKLAKNLPNGEERTNLLRNAEQCEAAASINGWLNSHELRPPESIMAAPFHFGVEQLTVGRWVITAAEAGKDPIYLIGVYTSRSAARDALPKVSADWMKMQHVNPLRLVINQMT